MATTTIGSHEQPDTASLIRFRNAFLKAVASEEPRVLRTLALECYPRYKKISRSHGSSAAREWAPREGVHDWARRWHLDAEWCLQRASVTLELWLACERTDQAWFVGWDVGPPPPPETPLDVDGDLDWAYWPEVTKSGISYEEMRNRLDMTPYDPVRTIWADVEASMKKEFKEHLIAYKARMQELIEKRGLVPMRWKTNHSHFIWLAQYQVQGRSYRQIADLAGDANSVEESGVQHAVTRLARLIGIALR